MGREKVGRGGGVGREEEEGYFKELHKRRCFALVYLTVRTLIYQIGELVGSLECCFY